MSTCSGMVKHAGCASSLYSGDTCVTHVLRSAVTGKRILSVSASRTRGVPKIMGMFAYFSLGRGRCFPATKRP